MSPVQCLTGYSTAQQLAAERFAVPANYYDDLAGRSRNLSFKLTEAEEVRALFSESTSAYQ